MPFQERVKVVFKRLYVNNDADWFGSGEFVLDARVDGVRVGNSNEFEAKTSHYINLDPAVWSRVVDVTGKNEFRVSLNVKDNDSFLFWSWAEDLGSVSRLLRRPFTQASYRQATEYFTLEWSVELEVEGAFGAHPPTDVFACRENNGSLDCTTVAGASFVARMECCPVKPVPPAASLPPRPAFITTAVPPILSEDSVLGTPLINPTDPINIIPNPAVIPLLTAAEATADTAARIEFTNYWPRSLAFTDSDPRLEWTVVSVNGGAACTFLGGNKGRKIKVYGTVAGEVRLECRFRGALFAQYRALVGTVRRIPCRFNILNGPTAASQPRATPANVQDHLAITNRFLRQMALELTLDTNPTRTNGAAATTIPGIFRIGVSAGTTRRVPVTGFMTAVRLNYRPNVMNFAYIHSDRSGNLGAASDYPASGAASAGSFTVAGTTVTDVGTPSASWNVPSGVAPDSAAASVAMTILAARNRPGHPNLVGMYVTDGPNGNPAVLADMQMYAGTIAHEFGHNLNLAHRVDSATSPFNDNVNHPPNENAMHWNNPTTLAQDFDVIQAFVARASPIVPP